MEADNGKIESLVIFSTFNPYTFGQIGVNNSGIAFDKIYKKDLIYRIADYLGPYI